MFNATHSLTDCCLKNKKRINSKFDFMVPLKLYMCNKKRFYKIVFLCSEIVLNAMYIFFHFLIT